MEFDEREEVYGRDEYYWGTEPGTLAKMTAEYVTDDRAGKRLLDLGTGEGKDAVFFAECGFDWGYAGSGPAQLALALLLDYTDDEDVALAAYMAFKTEVVSQLECADPDGCWRLTGREIDAALCESSDERVAPSVN